MSRGINIERVLTYFREADLTVARIVRDAASDIVVERQQRASEVQAGQGKALARTTQKSRKPRAPKPVTTSAANGPEAGETLADA